jgi:hypothetical protein
MEYTLRNPIVSYNPDTINNRAQRNSFPGTDKKNIENMGITGITFAPIVDLVGAYRLSPDAGGLQNFMKIQNSQGISSFHSLIKKTL